MQSRYAVASVVVALVMVLSGFGVLLSAAPSESNHGTPLQPVSAPALSAVLPTAGSTAVLAAEVGSYVGLSTEQVGAIQAWLGSLSPAQTALLQSDARAHATPTAANLEALGLAPASISYYCLGASIAAGTAVGGAVAGPFGALAGFIVGAVAGYYLCQQNNNGDQTQKAFVNWAETIISAYGNEVNLTDSSYSTIVSALNVSAVSWQRAADNAALLQLGNTTWNPGLDLFQSGIDANLAPVYSGYYFEVASEVNALYLQVNGHGVAGAVYSTEAPAVVQETSAGGTCLSFGTCIPATSGPASAVAAFGPGVNGGSTSVYIPHGANLTLSCPLGCTGSAAFYDQLTGSWFNTTIPAESFGVGSTGIYPLGSFSGPTGLYTLGGAQISTTATYVPNGQLTPTGPTGAFPGVGGARYIINDAGTGFSAPVSTDLVAIENTATGTYVTASNELDPNSIQPNLDNWLTAIEWTAETQAQAYWQFLHQDGFTSLSQIPADCIIPAPSFVLPSALNEANLTVSEWESLYLAALQGMGHFYNVTLDSTSFCGTQAVKKWSWGGSPWGNLFVNATGFVYLTNGTTPTNYAGKPDASEKFANTATWAIGNTLLGGTTWVNGSEQLLLMPTISTISIPVGVKWEVPQNNPVEVYAVQTGLDLWLNGNGTNSPSQLTPLATLAPGDALYLTSCTIGGTASSTCTVTVQTVNTTVTNITCNGPCSQGSGGGTFGGFPDPFSWLANLFGGLFGGGPLGSLLGGIVSALLILAVIIVLVYVAVVEVEAWGGKKKGGSSGSGGSTTIIAGGR